MSWFLLLLLPAPCLQDGNLAGFNREKLYGFDQPTHVSGVQGGSIEIPFSFHFPWELAKDPQMRILWRWNHYHGKFIYNSSSGFIHEHFKDRLILNWTHPQTSGVLRILDLKEKDQTVYFCRVHLKTTKRLERFQSINGTNLTITQGEHIPAVSTTMQSPSIVTSAVTTAELEDTEGQRNPSLVNLGATVGVVVATAVLITPVYVMLIFLWWKKRTDCSPWPLMSEHREQLRGRQRISMAATLTLVLLLQASRLKPKSSQVSSCHPKEQGFLSLLMALLVSLAGGIPDMAWVLLLLQAGNSAVFISANTFGVNQPARLSGVQGGSIEIPFSFYFPRKLVPDPQMTILWRWKHFHGDFINNSSSGFIHEHFKDRLILNWTQPQTSGILRILDLKDKDKTVYFCRVSLKTTKRMEFFQSIKGTQLTITRELCHLPPSSSPQPSNKP
ncbi:hypothetical protein U0070_019095 [Myodes glareolus]|uniref:Immunoglobulin domain-containing protein n=1 Tax=Myodes glareolus TaxID=447135 RepID=A0AAW0H451_MYOGA